MTLPMYILLLLSVICANAPFLTQRGLGVIPLSRKHFGHHLGEWLLGWVLIGGLAYLLEQRTGAVHPQGWAFYVVGLCVYAVFAFPAFVWRYFWHSRNKE